MRSLKFVILALGNAVLLAGAASAQIAYYGPATFWGGYKDKEIEPGVWQITASANAISGGESFTRSAVLYRSAEIAKAHGFSHFHILDTSSFDLGLTMGTASAVYYQSRGGPGHSKLIVRGATDKNDVEGCRAKKTESCVTLSVDAVMADIGPNLRFKKMETASPPLEVKIPALEHETPSTSP